MHHHTAVCHQLVSEKLISVNVDVFFFLLSFFIINERRQQGPGRYSRLHNIMSSRLLLSSPLISSSVGRSFDVFINDTR